MSHAAPSHTTSGNAEASPPANTRLHGRWLRVAQVAWVAVAGLALAVFIGSLPGMFAQSATVCRTALCTSDQLTPAAVGHLYALGLSLNVFAWYDVGLRCLFTVVFAAVGLIIFWRASADRTALVAAFTFVTFPITTNSVSSAPPIFLVLPAQIVNVLGSAGMSLLLYVFPDGRFVPRWTRWLWAVSQIAYAVAVFFPSTPFVLLRGQLQFPLLGPLVLSLMAVQIYRYMRVSTPVERQQTKWVVLGIAGGLIVFLLTLGLALSVPDLSSKDTLLYVISHGLSFLALMLIPLSFGVALLRYRLWDVDVLINRVLVYGLLTGLLGALYAGIIIGLASLAGAVTGQAASNQLVLVTATLVIATLILPVRNRLQDLIDRRFYRKKLDAAKTLRAFGDTLRQETDLEQVRAQLLLVVNETMQPAHVSLWLRPAERYPSTPYSLVDSHGQMALEPGES